MPESSTVSAQPPVRTLSPNEIERILAEHRRYLETEWRQGHRANFASADLSGAQLDGAELSRADLGEANLRGAGLRDARLGSVISCRASLHGANLFGAYLRLAQLDGADLSHANLHATKGLTQAQIDRAHFNSGTRLPQGLRGEGDAQ